MVTLTLLKSGYLLGSVEPKKCQCYLDAPEYAAYRWVSARQRFSHSLLVMPPPCALNKYRFSITIKGKRYYQIDKGYKISALGTYRYLCLLRSSIDERLHILKFCCGKDQNHHKPSNNGNICLSPYIDFVKLVQEEACFVLPLITRETRKAEELSFVSTTESALGLHWHWF